MSDVILEYRNALLSIAAGPLSAAERAGLSQVKASWVLLNTRLGRFYIDVLGHKDDLQAIRDKLIELGRDPIVIGIFKPTMVEGEMVMVLQPGANKAEHLKVAPDVRNYDAEGNLVSSTRPAAFVDIHRWAGWPDKVIP